MCVQMEFCPKKLFFEKMTNFPRQIRGVTAEEWEE